MPIYDVSYQRFSGKRTAAWARQWALARSSLSLLLRERRFLMLLFASWIPAIVRGGQIYAVRQFPQAATFLTVDASLWRDFLTQQVWLFVLLVALYAGSGSIASDFRSGALVIYLSKPVRRTDYILGKLVPLLVSLLFITLVPGITLYLLQLLMSEDLDFLASFPVLPLSVATYSLWISLYFTLTVLAVSSLSRSGRLAAAGFVMLALGTHFTSGIIDRMTFGESPRFVSMVGAAVDGADLFFPELTHRSTSAGSSVLAMAVLMAGSLWTIQRRLDTVEAGS